jgi:hypothetical protein
LVAIVQQYFSNEENVGVRAATSACSATVGTCYNSQRSRMVSAEAAAAAEASLARGEAAAARGDTDAALTAFRDVLALDPDYTTAQEWIATLTKHSALMEAGTARRRGSAAAASRARSPSPGRPSQALPATTSLHGKPPPPLGRVLCLLLLAVLYDTGQLHDAIGTLRGDATSALLEQDHYAILHLDPTATTQDVRKAFRERSKETHPDHCPADAPVEVCGQLVQESVTRAAEVLGDGTLRHVYDASRRATLAETLEAVARVGSSWSSGEMGFIDGLAAFSRATGLGFGTLMVLVWFLLATPRVLQLVVVGATLGGSYYVYSSSESLKQ